MTPRTVRRAERTVHLFWGLILALYVYGLLPGWGAPVVRWLVVPGIVGSGFAMWFAAPLRRLVKRLTATVDGGGPARNVSRAMPAAPRTEIP